MHGVKGVSEAPLGGEVAGLESHWTYEPEPLPISQYLRYGWHALGARAAPKFTEVVAVTPRPRWFVYFAFAPDGTLEPHHVFSLTRLRAEGVPTLVVFASRVPAAVPDVLSAQCDALIWKPLGGFDFSAYRIALAAIALRSPGAEVLVMNDSVYGPFRDLTPYFSSPWDLTGFTASNGGGQRHIQSYAFVLKDVTEARLARLRPVFRKSTAFNSARGAICCQELWLARAAARSMSVGALWYGERPEVVDPSLSKAIPLVDAGFPFLKRSLCGKHRAFQQDVAVRERLAHFGHPL